MHAAAAPAAAAQHSSHHFSDHPLWFHSFRQSMAMTAMGAEDSVFDRQMGTDSGGNSFLANVHMHAAWDIPAGITLD